MNISITRAKYSLFIVGHLNTLKVKQAYSTASHYSFLRNMLYIALYFFYKNYRHWKALIDDADSRGTIIKTTEEHYERDARKILKEDDIHSFPDPISHNQRTHPPYADTSRARFTFNGPHPHEYSHPPWSHEASLGMEPYGVESTFPQTSWGHYPEEWPRPWHGYSSNVAPYRHQTFEENRDRHYSYKHPDHYVWDGPWYYS